MDVDYLAELVMEETRFCSTSSRIGDPETSFYACLSIMNHVQTFLSAARYGWRRKHQLDFKPPRSVQDSLNRWVGLCGDHVAVYVAVAQKLGIHVRDLQVYYRSGADVTVGHTFVEANFGGTWHMFDSTWGAYFLDKNSDTVLDYSGAFRNKSARRVMNEIAPWTIRTSPEEAFGYLQAQDFGVIVDGAGTVRPPRKSSDPLVFDLTGLPRRIGVARSVTGRLGDISMEFDVGERPTGLVVKISAQQGRELTLELDDQIETVTEPATIEFEPVSGTVKLAVKARKDVGFVVLEDIRLRG